MYLHVQDLEVEKNVLNKGDCECESTQMQMNTFQRKQCGVWEQVSWFSEFERKQEKKSEQSIRMLKSQTSTMKTK